MSKKKVNQCHCSWEQCSWISEQIEAHAPEGHVWKGNYHRWSERNLRGFQLFERMLFLTSMYQHVPGIRDKLRDRYRHGYKREIVLARHHFPIAVYNRLMRRKITTLVTDTELTFLIKKEPNVRYDRAGKLASLVKTIIPPGKLLDEYTSLEKKCLDAKANLFLCAPAATEQEAVAVMNALIRQKEAQSAYVAKKSHLDVLLPGATYTIREMQALLSMASMQSGEQANEAQDEEQANEPQDEEQANEAQDEDISVQSSDFIPSKEQCVAKIQSKVQTLGIDRGSSSPSFCGALSALRRLHMDFSAIPLSPDGYNPSYLFPCKDIDLTNSSCETFLIATRWRSGGRFCFACNKAVAQNSQTEKKRGETAASACEENNARRKKRKVAPPARYRVP